MRALRLGDEGNVMEEWISLAVQIPIVAAFMLFVLELNKRNNEAQSERDAYWCDFFDKQQRIWQQFITDQRIATVAALSEVSDRLRQTTIQLEKLTEIITRHDEAYDQWMTQWRNWTMLETQPIQDETIS